MNVPGTKPGDSMVAAIHSHPDFLEGREENTNERFSGYTKRPDGTMELLGDSKWIKDNNRPLYLVTPSGKIIVKEAINRNGLMPEFNNRTLYKQNIIWK